MLYLSLTLDHEIWMGKNYLPLTEVLLNPTYQLVETLEEVGVKATFFTDVCFPLAFKNGNCSREVVSFIKEYENQLKYLTREHQDIQLHIHPHWFNARIDDNRDIEFNKDFYRIHNYGFNTKSSRNVYSIIYDGIDYLNNIIKSEYPDYKCIAYRAGGFCAQPELELFKVLYDSGIRIDSSVAMYCFHKGPDMYYDYSSINSPAFFVPIEGGFGKTTLELTSPSLFEVSIGGYNTIGLKNLISRINKPMNGEIRGCGMSLSKVKKEWWNTNAFFRKIHSALSDPLRMSIDSHSKNSLYLMIKAFARKYDYEHNDVFVSILGHPKILSKEHLYNFKELVKKLSSDKNIRFVTMRDIFEIKHL